VKPPLPQTASAPLVERLHTALDGGDVRRAKRILKKLGGETKDPAVHLGRWRLLTLDEDLEPAREVAAAAVHAFPEIADLQHALGWTQLELGAFEDAVVALEEACYLDPEFADAWHDLAIAREMSGDPAGMRTAFCRVFELDVSHPIDRLFSDDQVSRMAERAMAALPEEILGEIEDLPIFLQDYPDEWIVEDAPWDPRLLGLFDGPTWAELRGGTEGGVRGSPHIYLFTANLERISPDARAMAEQIRITLHHEVGHFLGLDEDDLHHRGLG
jgi:predicted Zn-dependent protease with MMP-like domain